MSQLEAAVSERAFRRLFATARDNFRFSASDRVEYGGYFAGYRIAAHLEDGSVDLRDDNTISVKELDIRWDTLAVSIGLDLPDSLCWGICLFPWWGGCALRLQICPFWGTADTEIELDLSGLVTSEVTVVGSPATNYAVDPERSPEMSPVQAQNAGVPNKWQVFLVPRLVDVDPLDVADAVGDLIEDSVAAAIARHLWMAPRWFRDLVRATIGPVIDFVREILDVPDSLAEWVQELLEVEFGLLNALTLSVAAHFSGQYPIHELEDPFPILPEEDDLIPVKIPIEDLTARVDSSEMVVRADVGA